jgi:hypothetical protein
MIEGDTFNASCQTPRYRPAPASSTSPTTGTSPTLATLSTISAETLSAETRNAGVNAAVTGLADNTVYYYQAVASNNSNEKSFDIRLTGTGAGRAATSSASP